MSSDLVKVAEAAGINISAAKAKLAELDAAFGGELGNMPDGVIESWVNEFFDHSRARQFFIALGKAWESEMASARPSKEKAKRGK